MKNGIQKLLIILVMNSLCSCTVIKVWEGIGKDEYFEITPEDLELVSEKSQQENLHYYCVVPPSSRVYEEQKCYIQKSLAEHIEDVNIRLRKTPAAIATDTLKTVVVIGYIWFQSECGISCNNIHSSKHE